MPLRRVFSHGQERGKQLRVSGFSQLCGHDVSAGLHEEEDMVDDSGAVEGLLHLLAELPHSLP